MSFSYIETEDCRKFFKRVYKLEGAVTMELVEELSEFGALRTQDFSRIIPNGRILYTIENKEKKLQIQGAVGSTDIYVVIPRKDEVLLKQFEGILRNFES